MSASLFHRIYLIALGGVLLLSLRVMRFFRRIYPGVAIQPSRKQKSRLSSSFFAIADSFPPSAKRKGTAPQLICCDSGPQFAPLRPVTIRNRKKVAFGHIFVFRPLGQPQDGAIGEKPQEWQLGITLYSTRNGAVRTRRIFICAVLIAGDTLNQKGWTIYRPAF